MKIPGIGAILEEDGPSGRLWRVRGVQLGEGVEEEHPDRKTLYIDVEPVTPRPPVPAAFQDAAPEDER